MYAEKIILETDQAGNIVNAPKLPANKKVEAIFLVLNDVNQAKKRIPHPDLSGKMKANDDIFDSLPTSDWNVLE